jgi:hypothetical protein
MANPVWGLLQKSLTDSETVEQAIDRLIAVHEADEESHLGVGESLQSHKAAEIIDHLASSIVEDKIRDGNVSLEKLFATRRIIISAFESLDGFGTTGSIIQNFGSVRIPTTSTIYNWAEIDATPGNWTPLDWTKNFFWQSTVKLSDSTDQQVYFGMGGSDLFGQTEGVGFRVLNGTLVCYHAVYSGGIFVYTTHTISGIVITNWNVYRIVYNATAGTLSFYVNGVLQKTWSSGLPTGGADSLCLYQIRTLDNAVREISVSDLLFSIDR